MMKTLIILAIVLLALLYAQRSWTPLHEHVPAQKPLNSDVATGGAREWQQAPDTVMGMQDAMGGASGGAARAARDAVTQQLGH